jgi:excisionase family DNA binding protein
MDTIEREFQKLLDYNNAARVLGIAAITLRRKVEAGEIPVVKFGRAVRFRKDELLAHLDKQIGELQSRRAEIDTAVPEPSTTRRPGRPRSVNAAATAGGKVR